MNCSFEWCARHTTERLRTGTTTGHHGVHRVPLTGGDLVVIWLRADEHIARDGSASEPVLSMTIATRPAGGLTIVQAAELSVGLVQAAERLQGVTTVAPRRALEVGHV